VTASGPGHDDGHGPAQGPTQEELLGYFTRLSNWGRWGPGDSLGTVNHITDERRARAVMRDLGIDANADQRLNREVESLRPLTVVDMFRHRDAETHRRPHGTTKEQQEKDERAEDSWARLMEDAQVRLGL